MSTFPRGGGAVTSSSRSGDDLRDLERELEAEREQAAELRALDDTKNTFLAAVRTTCGPRWPPSSASR